jgi:hypothetical protein
MNGSWNARRTLQGVNMNELWLDHNLTPDEEFRNTLGYELNGALDPRRLP